MQRSFLVVWGGLFVLSLSGPVPALSVASSHQEVLVDTGLSSIREPIAVRVYGNGEYQNCHAVLDLLRAAPPSRSLVPRPSELARELAKVMEVLRVATCWVEVWWADDGEPEERECLAAEFRFDGGSWSTVEDDRPC